MSYLTKRKLALIFCLGVSVAALAIIVLFTAKIYKADAQGIIAPCYPITGKTTPVKVKIGMDPAPDANGIANSGIIDFDDITILGENHRACVEIQPNGGLFLKGWAVNKKLDGSYQFGLISFYCNGSGAALGENRGFSCKDNYRVTVDKNGNFGGQAYNDFIGKFNFSGINLAGVSNMKLNKGAIVDGKAPISSGALDKWSWSDRIGWFDFTGVKVPIDVQKCVVGTTTCTAGIGACENTGRASVCNADGTVRTCNVTPKSPSLEICTDGIDNDCDGLTDGADPDCKIEGGCVGGSVCTAEKGACERTGITYCTAEGAKCTAVAGESLSTIDICGLGNTNCDGIDESNDSAKCCNYGDPECPPKPDFTCGPVSTSGNTKLQSGGTTASFSANRETIVRGIAKAKMESDYTVLTPPPNFIEDRSTYYYQNINVDVAWNGGTNYPEANKTIIVEGGDVYINSDFYNPNDKQVQIGIIALKSDSGDGGNVYIKNTVKNLQAQIFADGGVYSYKGDSGLASPPAGYSKTLNADFWRQLVIEGTVTSRDNTEINDATEKSFACLRPVKNTTDVADGNTADFTDIGQTNNKKKSVFIFYRAPNPALPVFGGFAGTGTRQGD